VFSIKNNLSLPEASSLVMRLESGEFGFWKPVKVQHGVDTEMFDKVSSKLLSSMRTPIDCTHIQISSAISSDRFPGDFGKYVCHNFRFFRLESKVTFIYKIRFRSNGISYLLEIMLPASSDEGGINISSGLDLPREIKLKLFDLLSLANFLKEDGGFMLDTRSLNGVKVLSFRDPSKKGGEISLSFSNLEETIKMFTTKLSSSDLINDLVNFSMICSAGYMDVDEIIEDSGICDLCAEISAGTSFDSFNLSWSRIIQTGWNIREERRIQTSANRPFLDYLGKLSDGQSSVDVGILYGSDGYGFSVMGAETIQGENSPILRFFAAAELTA
jgi:hypothetical protein